jgi:hypothetical protein
MMKKTYVFFSDPGHGWLAVPVEDVALVGAVRDISYYSYVKKTGDKYYVWLEEDCDAPAFLAKAAKAGWDIKIQEEPEHIGFQIRDYPSFDQRSYFKGAYK